MATRTFDDADQRWFAHVSGDANPLHMDPAFASQNFPGMQVVHGVHALLWGLEQYCAANATAPVAALNVTFVKPILLDDQLTLDSEGHTLRLLVRGETMAVVQLTRPQPPKPYHTGGTMMWTSGAPPLDHMGQDLAGGGAFRIPSTSTELAAAFPNLARAANSDFAAGLCAISTLVGMVCPGKYSLLSQINVNAEASNRDTLAFGIVRHDRRFSRVEMSLQGPGLSGTTAAFVGEAEQSDVDSKAIGAMVSDGEFAGQSPLIIGGTSGLGAATARLLAAGGGRPLIGYRNQNQAEAVAQTVRAIGECDIVPFDAMAPAQGLNKLAEMRWRGREIYYFASPRIFRRRIEPFQASDLRDFLDIFVNGFYETVRGLLELRPEGFTLFYPSTVALDEKTSELFEYRIAKQAGEDLCRRLTDTYRQLRIVTARLPRIATRQTRSAIKARAELPETAMAPYVREVQSRPET